MQAKFIIAAILVALFGLIFADGIRENNNYGLSHTALDTAHAVLDYDEAETLQSGSHESSLDAQHQEAKDANALLNALIKRLNDQIAADTANTNTKIQERIDSIKSFDAAVTNAQNLVTSLTTQRDELNVKLQQASTALATRIGERNAEQKAIEAENAAQRARLGERIAAIELQIALIRKILSMLTGAVAGPLGNSNILTFDDGADLLPGLFKGTAFETKKWTRCYRASETGYSSQAFHFACDGKANVLVVVRSANGNVFGAFSPLTYDGSNNYKTDTSGQSFIYSYINTARNNGAPSLIKIPNINGAHGNYAHTIYTHPGYGPTYGGGHDLYLPDRCNVNRGYSNPGYGYKGTISFSAGSTEIRAILAGEMYFTCAEYEVYYSN